MGTEVTPTGLQIVPLNEASPPTLRYAVGAKAELSLSEKSVSALHRITLAVSATKDDLPLSYSQMGAHFTPEGRILRVIRGSVAAGAGLRVGDLISAIDNVKVEKAVSAIDLWDDNVSQNDGLRMLKVWRGVRPEGQFLPNAPEWEYEEITISQTPHEWSEDGDVPLSGFSMTNGGAVSHVFPGTPADNAQLRAGDLIVEINSTPVGRKGADAWKIWEQQGETTHTLRVARLKPPPPGHPLSTTSLVGAQVCAPAQQNCSTEISPDKRRCVSCCQANRSADGVAEEFNGAQTQFRSESVRLLFSEPTTGSAPTGLGQLANLTAEMFWPEIQAFWPEIQESWMENR